MSIQRRFAPIGGRFEPEQVAGLTGIYNIVGQRVRTLVDGWRAAGAQGVVGWTLR
jgi:hypothetical protein